MARRKTTLSEIAELAGVSKSTVSLVLNNSSNVIPISEETKRRVDDAARELGYRPNAAARSLVTGRSNCILMVSLDLWDENLIERLRGVESCLVPKGYTIRICTADASGGVDTYTEILRSQQADGVLLTGLATPQNYHVLKDLRREAEAAGIPVVGVANAFPREFVDRVADIDDENGAREAVAHLIAHGHSRILFLGVAEQPWSKKRETGYRSALEAAGLPADDSLIVLGDRSQARTYDAVTNLCRELDFSAIFAVTDNMAIAAMAALKESGRRIPEDCAIIGFDNNEKIARFTDPPLTTVDNPFYDTGRSAADMLLASISEETVNGTTLPVSLVIRRSCGCRK